MDYVLRCLRRHFIPLVLPALTAGRLWIAAEFARFDLQNYDIAVIMFTALVAAVVWMLLYRLVCSTGLQLALGFVLVVLTSLATEVFLIAVQFASANNPLLFSNLQQHAEKTIVDLALNATAAVFHKAE